MDAALLAGGKCPKGQRDCTGGNDQAQHTNCDTSYELAILSRRFGRSVGHARRSLDDGFDLESTCIWVKKVQSRESTKYFSRLLKGVIG